MPCVFFSPQHASLLRTGLGLARKIPAGKVATYGQIAK
jgi:alkylated DNA nucleotide flippase Atl1